MRSACLLDGRMAMSKRDCRSCTVSTAWPYLENSIRSASQMAGRLAVGGIGRAFRQGNPAFDEADGATAFAATTAALALGPRQVVTPAIVLVAGGRRGGGTGGGVCV